MQVQSAIELYESDRPKIMEVVGKLREHVGQWREKEAFVREVMERFAEAGYLADVKVTTHVVGANEVYHPEVTISGRVDTEGGYDHDRQRHEVRAAEGVVPTQVAVPGAVSLWTPKGTG